MHPVKKAEEESYMLSMQVRPTGKLPSWLDKMPDTMHGHYTQVHCHVFTASFWAVMYCMSVWLHGVVGNSSYTLHHALFTLSIYSVVLGCQVLYISVAARYCRQLQLHAAACSGAAALQAAVCLPAGTARPHLRGSPVLRGHSAGHGGHPQAAPRLVCVRHLHQGPAGQASLICCCKLAVPLPVAFALAACIRYGLFWLFVCGMACFGCLAVILACLDFVEQRSVRCYADPLGPGMGSYGSSQHISAI